MNKLNEQYFKTRNIHKKSFKKYGWFIWIGVLIYFIGYIYNDVNSQLNKKLTIEASETGKRNINIPLITIDTIGLDLPWPESTTKEAVKAIKTSIQNINSSGSAYIGNFPASPGPHNVPFMRRSMQDMQIEGYTIGNNDIITIDFRPEDSSGAGNGISVEISLKTNKAIRVYMSPDA